MQTGNIPNILVFVPAGCWSNFSKTMISISRYITGVILFTGLSLTCKAQDFETLRKAITTAEDNRQFQTAIECWQKIIADDTITEMTPYRYSRIASLYDSLGNKEQAKAYRRIAVTYGKFDFSFFKRRIAVALADQFIEEKIYDSAIFYLRYAMAIPSRKNLCGSNSIYLRTDLYHNFMLAYEGLNQIDSAINCFLPYAFQDWTNNEGTECSTQHLFDGDYHCQLSDFLRVLRKKYSQDVISDEINNIISTVSVRSKKEYYNSYCSLNCHFSILFFNQTLDLDFVGIECPPTLAEEAETISFYKEWFIRDLHNSLIYLLNFSANNL